VNDALLVVTVTYHPDLDILARQLASLPADALKVVVDNASAPEAVTEIRRLVESLPCALLVENLANEGLAAAVNRGVSTGLSLDERRGHILLLDQDTEPEQGAVADLLAVSRQLASVDPSLGAVGPSLVDVSTGLVHGFHLSRGWRFVRFRPSQGWQTPVRVMGLNGSGTLVSVSVWNAVGGLDESLFIDHVDTEWSFRLQHAGYNQYGVPTARFLHRMGTKGLSYWFFGRRVWPHRSSLRHFYLFRNTVRLLGMRHVSRLWKFWAPCKLCVTALLYLLFDSERAEQLAQMRRGIRAGRR
jgi:rhamnosyltransferase